MYSIEASHETHKDQGCTQVLVMLLKEFLVVLVGHFAIVCVESSLVVSLSQRTVLLPAKRWS